MASRRASYKPAASIPYRQQLTQGGDMATWVKCTAYNEDRAIYLNLEHVVSISRGSSWTTVMFAVGYDNNAEAGMMSIKETPEEVLASQPVAKV
jgi:hypothetical protein